MAGGYKPQPQGIEAIVAKFRESEKVQADLRKMITGFGLTVDPQGNLIFDATGKNVIIKNGSGLDIQDDGTLHVAGDTTLDGDLTATSGTLKSGNYVAGTSGWRLLPTGNVEINDITLRGGIIGNPALANPVVPDYIFNVGSGYSLPPGTGAGGGGTTRASQSLTVPTGFTKALIWASVSDFAVNSTASIDFINSYIDVNVTANTWAEGADVPAGAGGASIAIFAGLLTGLSGGNTITFRSRPYSTHATWAALGSNSTVLQGVVLYLR